MRFEIPHFSPASGTRADRRTRREPSHVNGLAPVRVRPLLSCRRAVVLQLPSCLTAKHANSWEIARNAVIPIIAGSAALTSARRDRQQAPEWGSDAHSESQIFAPRLQVDRLLHHRSANAQTAGT
jgi:hypothetical protein